jgi:hypothetical protein
MLSPGRGYCNKTANARASGITGREVYRARAPFANFSRDLTPPSASTTSVRRVSDLGGWHRVLKVKTRLKSNEKNEPLARCQSVFALAPATQRSASAAACAIDRSTTSMLSPAKIAILLFFWTMALAAHTSGSQLQDPQDLIFNANIALERVLLPLSSCCSPRLRFTRGSSWCLLPFNSLFYLCQCHRRPDSPRSLRGCRNRC